VYYLTCSEYDCTSATCTFNWNTSVTGHKQERDGFLQSKQLPSSTASSSVSISNKLTHSLTDSKLNVDKTVSSKTLTPVYLHTDRHITVFLMHMTSNRFLCSSSPYLLQDGCCYGYWQDTNWGQLLQEYHTAIYEQNI
jgi:hypothetical protein